jgi:hypothetical protein
MRYSLVCDLVLPQEVVALGIELSAAALSGPLGQPALDYLISRALRSRTENPPAPKAGVLPSAPPPDC